MANEADGQRELAFGVYARFGGRNVRGMLEGLEREHGLKITRQTLHRWRGEGGWDERLRAMEPEQCMLNDLREVIDKLKRQMRRSAKVEPQVAYAYANMLNCFFAVARKSPRRFDPEKMKHIAAEILENEYGVKRSPD